MATMDHGADESIGLNGKPASKVLPENGTAGCLRRRDDPQPKDQAHHVQRSGMGCRGCGQI